MMVRQCLESYGRPHLCPDALTHIEAEIERLRAKNERWRERVKYLPDHSNCEAENKRLDKARHAAIEIIAKQNDDVLRLVTEVERLRAMEEPLRTLYRFVMESWYARNLAVPSGVLERARQALGDTT
jgi:hypothetical protein